MAVARSSLSISMSVWKALFLREAISRISASRGAWIWLFVEPIVHILFMLVIYTVIRMRVIPGADAAMWLLVGLSCFLTARNIFTRAMASIDANQALFAYRQVLPVDPVLVRSALETILGVLVIILLLTGAAIFNYSVFPYLPMQSLFAFLGMCLCGLGFALSLSVAVTLVPELGKIARFLFRPLYLMSGVVIPVAIIPVQYREWLFYIPFTHGLELLRGGFFPLYHVDSMANFTYLYGFAAVSIFFGLALQIRYSSLLRAQ